MSIYKRKRKNGARYTVVVESNGRRVSVGTFRTSKEAESAERKALEARERGHDLSSSKATIDEVVAAYLDSRSKCGQDTLDTYSSAQRLYIAPHLGDLQARALRPAHVASWYAMLLREGGRSYKDPDRARRPLGVKTAWNAFTLLSSALEWAAESDIVGRNVCKIAAKHLARPTKALARAFSDDEVAKILGAAADTRWANYLMLALATAARRGELLALNWTDIDLDGGRMLIAASMSETSKGVVRKGTKTERERGAELSPPAVAALRAQRAQQAADRLSAAPGIYVEDRERPVFTDERGRRYTPKAATWAFRVIAQAAGVEWTRLHGTRHTAITTLIAEGYDPTTVAKIAGHSTPSTTLDIYSHAIRERERAAVDGLGAHLERLRSKS